MIITEINSLTHDFIKYLFFLESPQTGELRIVRIDKCSSLCTGNEEVFILVEKVDKRAWENLTLS